MKEIAQIRKLSLWIFLIPLLAINLCLIISQNSQFLENTIFSVDMIGRSGFSIPYLDGSLSISRASRTFPQYLIFKPAMFLTSYLLIKYWLSTKNIINHFNPDHKHIKKIFFFGIASAIFLTIHSLFLGIKIDNDFYKLSRRFVMLAFIIFELVAQAYLVATFLDLKKKLQLHINEKVLKIKKYLITILITVSIIALPFFDLISC